MLSLLISQFCILFIEIISFIQGCMCVFVCKSTFTCFGRIVHIQIFYLFFVNKAVNLFSHILFIKCYESKSLFPCTITSNDVEFASTNPRMNEACQPCWTRNSGSAPGCSLYCSTSWWCWWGGPTRV